MQLETFEIKVALIGNVSAGKTTVINALFRDSYGEVSMKRTTAGVNLFRIARKSSNATILDDHVQWSMIADDPRTAESILKEITEDNAKLRQSNVVEEKIFEVELQADPCEMRPDTQLVFVDVPGINEAACSNKYKDYVEQNWTSFDCVVVVMDGRQGVNTEEQVGLLKFVKANIDQKKNLPVIILCNKVDDPEDEEQIELIAEARQEVEAIFGVTDRLEALEEVMDDTEDEHPVSPVFVPISAINGYIFRCASHMTPEQFSYFDKKLIDKVGRERIGRTRWRNMPVASKFKEAHAAITDPKIYRDALEESSFDKFMLVLTRLVGNVAAQSELIESQLVLSLKLLTIDDNVITILRSVYSRSKALGMDDLSTVNDSISTTFWQLYKATEERAFDQLTHPSKVDALVVPLKELIYYHKLAGEIGVPKEQEKSLKVLTSLVRRQIAFVVNELTKQQLTTDGGKLVSYGKDLLWEEVLSPFEWSEILGSILLNSCDKTFCLEFGREKIMLEQLVAQCNFVSSAAAHPKLLALACPVCSKTLDFNRRCSSCSAPALPETEIVNGTCPVEGCDGQPRGMTKCTNTGCSRSAYHVGPSFHNLHPGTCHRCEREVDFKCISCPICFASWNLLKKPPKEDALACRECTQPLDFHRHCMRCSITYKLDNACECGVPWSGLEQHESWICSCGRTLKKFSIGINNGPTAWLFQDGKLVPLHPKAFETEFKLQAPESVTDPKHFGHLAWTYCEFVAGLKA